MSIVEIKEARKKRDWQSRVQHKGLCVNCNLASECTFPRNPDRPVMNCDEFDCTLERLLRKEPEPEVETKGNFKGLCVNCALRETCVYPKPEWGVWHCEEYE
jgi:CRISPR/Cas system-associated exonuclease Cas4 (RecB family)